MACRTTLPRKYLIMIAGGYHEVPADPEKFTADGWLRTGSYNFV